MCGSFLPHYAALASNTFTRHRQIQPCMSRLRMTVCPASHWCFTADLSGRRLIGQVWQWDEAVGGEGGGGVAVRNPTRLTARMNSAPPVFSNSAKCAWRFFSEETCWLCGMYLSKITLEATPTEVVAAAWNLGIYECSLQPWNLQVQARST